MPVDSKSEVTLLEAQIPDELGGKRLDQVLAKLFEQYSRSRLQAWVKTGSVTIDGQILRSKDKVAAGQHISIDVPEMVETNAQAQAISLDIVFEDEQIIVINKQAGLVVHPAAGNPDGTLLNALLHHDESLNGLPRGGIVHRIDKETTGLLVVARTLSAHKYLVEQLQEHNISREYLAITQGVMTAGGTVEAALGRHPVNRKRMAVVSHGGKEAVSHYRVLQRYRAHTAIKVNLETGRTHQIRVHMAHIRYPLVGDQVYGGRFRIPAHSEDSFVDVLRNFKRQALHAQTLRFEHPISGEDVEFHAPVPEDMQQLMTALEHDLKINKSVK